MRPSTPLTLAALVFAVVLASGCGRNASTTFSPAGDDTSCNGCCNDAGCPTEDDEPPTPGDDIAMGPQPQFGPTVSAAVAPPPISGGTLLVLHDGTVAASDPDRDAVYIVDEQAAKVRFTIALQPGDEPGRLAQDAAGRVHVALRRGGALVTVDPTQGTVLARRAVCPAPRGVAYDASSDSVWVACATGELVSLPAAGGAATKTLVLERDLRDVVLQSGAMAVSEFRSAQVLRLAADGSIARRDALPAVDPTAVPHVAWRTVAGPAGTLVIAHQEESTQSLATQQPGGYGASGPPAVDSVVTVLAPDGTVQASAPLDRMALPVDVAVSPDGSYAAVVAAGVAFLQGMPNVAFVPLGSAGQAPPLTANAVGDHQAIAVAFDTAGHLLLQTREPAALYVMTPGTTTISTIALSTVSRDDTGQDVFQTMAPAGLACASCHPEGGDDGHVWMLDGQPRRTPSLRGTIAGTAPYHWPGNQPDVHALVDDVYTRRMAGASLDAGQIAAIESWVDAIPAPPAPSWIDTASAQRGQAIFQRTDVGCSSCHSGAKLTDNATVDVGTGGAFQVPPLVGVGWRTPLLHDGCATTIADRFGKCSTAQHGSIAGLSTQDLADLEMYLQSL